MEQRIKILQTAGFSFEKFRKENKIAAYFILEAMEKYADEKVNDYKRNVSNCKKQNGWIATSDRLPEKQGMVLAYCPRSFAKNCRIVVCEYYEDSESFYGEYSEDVHEDVTHWMPVPFEPSKE